MPPPFSPRIGFLVALHLMAGAVLAQLPEARLSVLMPPGGRAGETVSVSVTGMDMEGAALRFSHEGITATADDKDPKKFAVTVAPHVPLGLYDARLYGKYGVSNPRRFEVSEKPEIEADVKALTKELSQEITIPCTVRGSAIKQQIQWFKIPVVSGKAVHFDCHAGVLDSRMDPLLVLYNAKGRELARSHGRALLWTPTDDQPVFLALRDFISNGGTEHFYRLHVGMPQTAEEPWKKAISDRLVFWPFDPKAVAEVEPNDVNHPQRMNPPCEIRGDFYPARDVDAFVFEAKKGDTWWVDCTSSRLGAPTHPRVVIERLLLDGKGGQSYGEALELKEVPWFPGDPDFDGQHFDPAGKFEAKEDGTYRVVLRDINNSGALSRDRRYILSVRKAAPDFGLVGAVLTPIPNKALNANSGPLVMVRGANARPGQILPVRVMAVRRDGFREPIKLSAVGLPPGVTADESVVGTDQSEGTLLLRVSGEAKAFVGAIKIKGSSRVDGREIVQMARASTPLWESGVNEFVEPQRSRLSEEFSFAIVEDVPFPSVVRTVESVVEAAPTDKVKIGLQLTRREESSAAVKLKPVGFGSFEKSKEVEIPAKGDKAEYELDLAPLKLSPGDYSVWFKGEEKVKRDVKGKSAEVGFQLCSNPLLLRIKEAAKK